MERKDCDMVQVVGRGMGFWTLTIQPMMVFTDVECAKEFILYNIIEMLIHIGRSPWSNKYYPTLEDGSLPSTELRKLEIEANDVFAVYRDQ
ncbi:hypothetical protein HPP92_020342 [Vanilla planifolia]|nr:hypothetical protein HPP92_020342 [Vanilla planifolia]